MTDASAVGLPMSLADQGQLGRSLFQDTLRRFVRNPLAVIGLVVIVVIMGAAIFADRVAPYKPDDSDLSLYVTPPTAEHVLGTDDIGRDILTRLIYGARISLSVSILATLLGLVVGTL